ncbi:zinc-ribbon domain-containing protein [Butyricicoccus pullicaecorum]|uniref:zinc-ribbon domain-containing protein n=1 Tax=Butyricicoccus pullicaecorum TaxID=501571 RepID=UPI001FA883B5|nr:zinc-ribbon domain-containing protein [Butyricicoccus pullicaecorum]
MGSHRKVWWQCPEGHVGQAVIYARTGGKKCGCPVCAGRVKNAKTEKYRKIIADII